MKKVPVAAKRTSLVIGAGLCLVAGLATGIPAASAGDLVYTPINPSFGGNPLNSSHLLGLANAQRTATARSTESLSGGLDGSGSGATGSSDAELFVRQLQGRLLSALASQVTDAIFGPNPEASGTIKFGDTTIFFDQSSGSEIVLRITEATGVTEIVVPRLVTLQP